MPKHPVLQAFILSLVALAVDLGNKGDLASRRGNLARSICAACLLKSIGQSV